MAKSENKRIGILGGSFNPIHIAHLAFAQRALDELKLDFVIFVPAYIAPHKKPVNFAGAKQRLKMVKLATASNKDFGVSDFEIKSKKISYTIETLQHLKNKFHKGAKFYFLIGSDLVSSLKSWKHIRSILKIAAFAVAIRSGKKIHNLPDNAVLISMPQIEISSTLIRRYIKNGWSTRYLLPDKVRRYIIKNRLYS